MGSVPAARGLGWVGAGAYRGPSVDIDLCMICAGGCHPARGHGRVKPGSGARAGQTWIRKAGGLNPKQEMRRAKKRENRAY